MTAIPPPLTPGLDELCPQCGVQVGDHTLRGWGDCLHAAGFNTELPYAEVPGGPMRFPGDVETNRIMVGQITVRAGSLDTPLGRMPTVLFTFYGPGLTAMSTVPSPEYALVGDARMMRSLKNLVAQNADAAIRAAS